MGNFPIGLIGNDILMRVQAIVDELSSIPEMERLAVINEVKIALHKVSPMCDEPVDCVLWVPADTVDANDYNPNVVASPEMKLLKHSVRTDHFTQPIVTWMVRDDGQREVVDGFHRKRVGTECRDIKKRIMGLLPVTTINTDRQDRADRIGSTIRHNRARGKHLVKGMSDIVLELARRNWSDKKIAQELGMGPDEVLRLKQISGLAEAFADQEFSEAWEVVYQQE
jgi:ParB-like chromosome segregation protein Spo0J